MEKTTTMKEQTYIAGKSYIIKHIRRNMPKDLKKIQVIEVTSESIYFLDCDFDYKERWGYNMFDKTYRIIEEF
jgi:hypothetical protein